jgi:hypothetical protein
MAQTFVIDDAYAEASEKLRADARVAGVILS